MVPLLPFIDQANIQKSYSVLTGFSMDPSRRLQTLLLSFPLMRMSIRPHLHREASSCPANVSGYITLYA